MAVLNVCTINRSRARRKNSLPNYFQRENAFSIIGAGLGMGNYFTDAEPPGDSLVV